MGGFRYNLVNSSTIKNILTLRYNPTKKTLVTGSTWEDFVEKKVSNPTDFIEKSIQNTIKNELGNSKKVSIALSGGIDSTLILAMLRKTLPDAYIEAISFKFADSTDESTKAAKIAKKFEANHHIVYIENYLRELPKAISITELPFWDLHWYYVVKKAKSLSNFLISGDGGDELFGGYIFRYEKFLSLINPNSLPIEKVKAYLQCHERDWVPDQEHLFGKKARFSWNEIYNMLIPYFDNSLPPLAQVFLADFNGKLLHNWIPLNTKFHNYFRVKLVAPILSPDLIAYATHLPYNLKYDQQKDIGKIVLRKILAKYVRNDMITRRKHGFSVNTVNLLNSHGLELCDQYLTDARITKYKIINQSWINQHIKELRSKPDVKYVNKFLGLLALEIWFRLFVTKEIKQNTKL